MYPEVGAKLNLKILRAIRVLRPLKLVAKVPSMSIIRFVIVHRVLNLFTHVNVLIRCCCLLCFRRSSSCAFFDIKSNGTVATNRIISLIRNHYIRYYWIRILFGHIPQ